MGFVVDNYQHLLSPEETRFFKTYQSLSDAAQQLYCRLLMRKRDYIRVSKTGYPEIDSMDTALAELAEHSMCVAASIDDLPHWTSLFRQEEMRSALPSIAKFPHTEWTSDPDRAFDYLTRKDLFGMSPADLLLQSDAVYRVEHKDAFTNFQLLFFGDLYQDISAFVLRDLGFTRFETILHKDLPLPFSSRTQLMAHRHFYACIDNYDDELKANAETLIALHQQLLEIPIEILHVDSALKRRLEKWFNRIARQLERLDHIECAASIYETNDQPPARERLARIRAKQGQKQQAFSICQAMISHPGNAEEQDFAEQFAQPLAKTLGIEYRKVNKYDPPSVTLTLPPSRLSVEYATALHYAKTGKCFYVENTLVTAMFGLAMWDIIFAPIAGAFYHPFQTGPADFKDPDFTHRRKHLVATRMHDMQCYGLTPFILPNLYKKNGINNPLVNWFAIDRQLIVLAIDRIPLHHWLHLFDYLLQDISAHRSGLPDLIFFPDCGGYELLEIKGPGDQLQKNQRRWMKHFAACDIPHAVVHVEFSGTTN